jgi:hypothetical protein
MVITSQPRQIARTPLRPLPSTDYDLFAFRHPGFVTQVAGLRRLRDRKLMALQHLSPHEKRSQVRSVLRDGRLAVLYAYEALRATNRLAHATPDTISALALRCVPFAPSQEPIRSRQIVKYGRHRTVYDFGPVKRMQQLLVADLLRYLHPPRPEQSLFNGGMPDAFRSIEAAFRAGYTHALEIDFVGFYGSVRLVGLAAKLHPLPDAVVRHVIWDEASRCTSADQISLHGASGAPPLSDQVGLPLGAATSPIVGETIIGRLLASVVPRDGVKIVTYADNLLVLGRSVEEALAGSNHLRILAETLTIGSLRPSVEDDVRYFSEEQSGINWMRIGVTFASQIGQLQGQQLSWGPNERKQEQHRIGDSNEATLADIAQAERQVSRVRRAYPQWQDGDIWEASRLAELAAARFLRSAEPEHKTAACHALVIAHLATGQMFELYELSPDGTGSVQLERRRQLISEAQQMLNRFSARRHQVEQAE